MRPAGACEHSPACPYPGLCEAAGPTGRILVCVLHLECYLAAAREARWRAAGSPAALASQQRLAAIRRRPRPGAIQHWRRAAATAQLPLLATQYAAAALRALGASPEREPGEDG